MKIVQAYSSIKTNVIPQFNGEGMEIEKEKLFYSFLYSYITLKKHYGSVTMYCDQTAYDELIKYIPYDEVIIKENKYVDYPELWSVFKIEALRDIKTPFIFVDPDVFIYDNVFDKFIKSNDDILVQSITDIDKYYERFFSVNSKIFKENDIPTPIDKLCWDGVFGFNDLKVFKNYLKVYDFYLNTYLNNEFFTSYGTSISYTELCEVVAIISTVLKYDYSLSTIYNEDEFDIDELLRLNNRYKFVHLVGKTKYDDGRITLMKNDICEIHGCEYYDYLYNYENKDK